MGDAGRQLLRGQDPQRTPRHLPRASIRIARGVYYRPGTFRSPAVEWDETVHADTGLLGFTTKHLYFSRPNKKFQSRYDRVVDFEPFSHGFGIMRDAHTSTPQTFRTGDGCAAYDLTGDLAQT